MRSMTLFALLAAAVAALLLAPGGADARPRRGCVPAYAPACQPYQPCQSCPQAAGYPYQFAAYSPGGIAQPVAVACPDGRCPIRVGSAYSAELVETSTPAADGTDALAEVNAKRASRGLRPFLRDEGLTRAARDCAAFRASRLMFGHVTTGGGDFQFCRYGSVASATGCAAYPASYGFMACCVYDGYTYAGAASVIGPDGRVYHSLFVR